MRRSEERRWGTPLWRVRFRAKRKALPKRLDFAVVGGGFAGLSAAAHLARMAPGKSVLLLEASGLGAGASGRTGGLALADSAAGKLAGLGNVLAGYKRILREMGIEGAATFPGVWEIGRGGKPLDAKDRNLKPKKNSPMAWKDSGILGVVRSVAGGMADPGKVISGLARAAERAGAQIIEEAEVRGIEFSEPLRLKVRARIGGRKRMKTVFAERVVMATNGGSLDLSELKGTAEPKLTFAIATEPLSRTRIAALGLAPGKPFYTLDLPYLWGRLAPGNRIVFGSGLAPGFDKKVPRKDRRRNAWGFLAKFDVRKGEAAECVRSLEKRVHGFHEELRSVKITHRWGGPIAFTNDFRPVFRQHSKSPRVVVLGAFAGHGVALSVYLGRWAAQSLLGQRLLPRW